ncbi:hypothetical protein, partial [Peribacillus simplex]|uniref:hypothetical protein n=1 Tax=Peribacillus simplex TaxID=1478 RepID=UPI0016265192
LIILVVPVIYVPQRYLAGNDMNLSVFAMEILDRNARGFIDPYIPVYASSDFSAIAIFQVQQIKIAVRGTCCMAPIDKESVAVIFNVNQRVCAHTVYKIKFLKMH